MTFREAAITEPLVRLDVAIPSNDATVMQGHRRCPEQIRSEGTYDAGPYPFLTGDEKDIFVGIEQ